jgi:glycosyltransferase involved in cell wall biosynthesis
MSVRLTILIPTYNRGELISKTIENCFRSSYKNFNIIIYDDASKDNTQAVISSLMKTYPGKIKYFKGDVNKGIGYARNYLINKLNTEYGMWLDSDDLMTPDRIEKCIYYMDSNPTIDIAYSNIQWFSGDHDLILRDHIKIDITKYDKNVWDSLKSNTACATGFFRKSINKFKFEESLKLGGEDVLWIWSLLQHDIKIGHINESLYLYRNHANRIGRQKRQDFMQELKKTEDIILSLKIKEIQDKNI